MSKQKISFLSLLFVFGIFTFFTSCQPDEELELENDEEVAAIQFPGVDPDLWSHFANFESEAAARGLDIDLASSNITGEIAEISQEHVAGRCSFSNSRVRPNEVTIDRTFWNRSSPLFREFVVFHELGHCFLGRGHEEATNANGTCISIMRSGVEDCRDNYFPSTRAEYIDELFDPFTL